MEVQKPEARDKRWMVHDELLVDGDNLVCAFVQGDKTFKNLSQLTDRCRIGSLPRSKLGP